jgi:tetratricopeptide (TPR) repeat protein/transcriptional regulator with XRE-family HTH domain
MQSSSRPQRNQHLRRERLLRNWRQHDLAEQLGTTPETIKRWESGRQRPSPYFRVKLCTLFGKSAQELGLLEGDPSASTTQGHVLATKRTEVSPAGLLMLWTVPYRRNPHFTGRDELLEHLAQQLSFEQPGDATTTRQVVLTQAEAIKGLGGIGKTQIAVEYAYRAREQDRYRHTLWINAASEEAILSSFAALAELLPSTSAPEEKDQRKRVVAMIRWLEQCQDPWLLIFDNADDLSLVQQYIPRQGNGSLLLTTRAHAVAALASSLEVEAMGVMEGTHFLLHRTQRLDATDEESNEATNVVIALDGFPLALDQAGAYIEETGCSFADYLQLYEQHRATLLARRGKQATQYPHSVATTWSLSFQRIEQANPAAAELLRLCAFLAPDHIPEELLRQGAPHWPPALQEAVSDLFAFNQMLEDLLKFSLIKRLVEEHQLSIHRLVQVVQRERVEPNEQEHWATRVVHAVNAVFPPDPKEDIATWPQCQRYLEQVQTCDLLIQQYGLGFSEAADVLNRAGIYLREQALYALAEPLFQRALAIREQLLGSEHLDTAQSLRELASLYWLQGKQKQAEPLHQRALAIREQLLGSEHPDTAQSLNDLALLSSDQGKYEQAERFYQRALHIRERHLGPEHPKVAILLNNLANLYSDQGKYEQAERFHKRALHIRKRQLGPEHPSTAISLANLAEPYYEQEKYGLAKRLCQRALPILEQQLGPEHPDVGYPLHILALVSAKHGKYEEAERLDRRALQIWEERLGSEHPQVAYPLTHLGELSVELGRYAEAESLLQRALHIWEQQVGPDHDAVASPLTHLGNLYVKQGKHAEAEPLYQRALRIREQALGSKHPEVVYVLLGLANLYCQQGRYQQAEPLYQRALSIRERQTEFSYATAQVMHDVARFQEVQGNKEEARIWYERALTIREQVLGLLHPKTKETHTCLIALLHAMGQCEDASLA